VPRELIQLSSLVPVYRPSAEGGGSLSHCIYHRSTCVYTMEFQLNGRHKHLLSRVLQQWAGHDLPIMAGSQASPSHYAGKTLLTSFSEHVKSMQPGEHLYGTALSFCWLAADARALLRSRL